MIRDLFAFIDVMVYGLITLLMRLITIVAYTDFFTNEVIADLKNKVFIVLSVVMLFKIVVSCIQYIMSPDTFDDKEKGMGGILKRAAISIVLLLAVDPLFNFAMDIQITILDAMPRLIFSENAVGEDYDIDSIGNEISWALLSSFITKDDEPLDENCPFGDFCDNPILGFGVHHKDGCDFILGLFGCDYEYKFILSTICGAFVAYSFLGMLLDVGTRVIKLGIIRILYPIPVANYINDKESLNKFFKTSISIYTDLFIRMIVIYLIVYLTRALLKSFFSNDIFVNVPISVNFIDRTFVRLILILALIFFMKKAPQFICDLLGVEGKGEGFKDMFTRPFRAAAFTKSAARDLRSSLENSKREAGPDDFNPTTGKWNNKKAKRQALLNALRTGRKSIHAGAKSLYRGDKSKQISQNMRDAAAEEHDLNRQLYENNISRSQYRDAVRLQKRGIISEYASADKNAQAAKTTADSAKDALDYGYSIASSKLGHVTVKKLDPTEQRKLMDSIKVDSSDSDICYFGTGAKAVNINLEEFAKGRISYATVLQGLRQVAGNTTGDYSKEEVIKAGDMLDNLQGIFESDMVSLTHRVDKLRRIAATTKAIMDDPHASAIEVADATTKNTEALDELKKIKKETGFTEADVNVAFKSVISSAEIEAASHPNTPLERRITAETLAKAKDMGYTGLPDEAIIEKFKEERFGDYLTIVKKIGLDEHTASSEEKVLHSAEAIARELAEKHKNDK